MLAATQSLPRITAAPNRMEATIIYRAQSLLTKNGTIGPLLPYDEARQVLIDAGELRADFTLVGEAPE